MAGRLQRRPSFDQRTTGALTPINQAGNIMKTRIVGHFNIGAHLAGAPTFKCILTLSGGRAVGAGSLTQALSPPLDLDIALTGTVAEIVWGADVTQVIALTGGAFPAGLPLPPYPQNFESTIQVDSAQPGKGKATVGYLGRDGEWYRLNDLPVQVTWQTVTD
jgi:hypothetical protein